MRISEQAGTNAQRYEQYQRQLRQRELEQVTGGVDLGCGGVDLGCGGVDLGCGGGGIALRFAQSSYRVRPTLLERRKKGSLYTGGILLKFAGGG